MKPGDLVKYADSVGQNVGVLLGKGTWRDQGGPYEMWEILSDKDKFIWLPEDAFEVIQ